MSAEVERIKKLADKDLIIDAVEIPTNHRNKAMVVDDLQDLLDRFDDDADHAHFIVRVKRSTQPLPKPPETPQEPQLTIDAMVSETMAMTERLTEEREYDPEFLLENAKLLEENGDFLLARNIFNALVRKGSCIPAALAGMARTFEREGDKERAVRCYREAIAYSSELSFYQALAALQIRMGEDAEASETIIHSLGLTALTDDQKFDLHKSLGNCFTRLAEFPKAEHHYRKAYELNPRSDTLQVNVGSLALQKNDYDAAQKHFQKALDLSPRNDKAVSGLGMVYLAKNNVTKAHDHFVASLKLQLNNLGAIYNLVKCAYEIKKFDDAALILKQYIETNPVNTNILYSYAGILYHQGEYTLAHEEVRKILESNSSHAGAKELGELIAAKISS